METVKEKIDNVRHGRKRSKEMPISHVKPDSAGTDVPQNLVSQEELTHHLAQFTLNNNEQIDKDQVIEFTILYPNTSNI